MEIAKALKRTRSSVVRSTEWLARNRFIAIDMYGPGVPPSISVHGFKVMLLEDV